MVFLEYQAGRWQGVGQVLHLHRRSCSWECETDSAVVCALRELDIYVDLGFCGHVFPSVGPPFHLTTLPPDNPSERTQSRGAWYGGEVFATQSLAGLAQTTWTPRHDYKADLDST